MERMGNFFLLLSLLLLVSKVMGYNYEGSATQAFRRMGRNF